MNATQCCNPCRLDWFPALGLNLIQVGRKGEVAAALADLNHEQGGAAFRIVVGRFGSGKSFFLNLVRNHGVYKRMVVVRQT